MDRISDGIFIYIKLYINRHLPHLRLLTLRKIELKSSLQLSKKSDISDFFDLG